MIQYANNDTNREGCGLFAALWSEALKLLRSKISWITVIALVFITLICSLFIYILKDPEQARQLGILSTKAQMFGGTADWSNFFNLVFIIMSYAGTVIFGFIFVWIFGREFGNKTVYDILAIPTSRTVIVSAKIITAAAWSFFLILLIFIVMLIMGTVLGLPGGSSDIIAKGFLHLIVTGSLTVILSIPFALVASVTRGYLPAVGCLFLVIILSQVTDALGYSLYFPWSVPALYSGAAEALTGTPTETAGAVSYVIVGLTAMLAAAGTALWWRYSDQC